MITLSHLVALILRLGFLVAGSLSACMLFIRKAAGPATAAALAFALAMLFGSTALAIEGSAVSLAVVWAGITACMTLSLKMPQRNAVVILAALMLLGVGTAVGWSTQQVGVGTHVMIPLLAMVILMAGIVIAPRTLPTLAAHHIACFVTAIALVGVAVVFGVVVNGSNNWLIETSLGASVQPSELAKVAMAVAVAAYLCAHATHMRTVSLRGVLPLVAVFVIALVLLLLGKDLGCGLILLMGIAVPMVALTSGKAGFVYGAVALVAVALLCVIAYEFVPHAQMRILAWLHPEADSQGAGYQLLMGQNALANGGLFGTGIGFGTYTPQVPVAESDMVFCAIVEQLGLVGGLMVIVLFAALIRSLCSCAQAAPRGSFESNFALACGSIIGAQAFIILAGSSGLLPLTGVTLPLVSAGGSSLLSVCLLIGLAVGCTKGAEDEEQGVWAASKIVPASCIVALLAVCVCVFGMQQGLALFGQSSRAIVPGGILASDGETLAYTDAGETKERMYPQGSMAAHLLGAMSGGLDSPSTQSELAEAASPIGNVLAIDEQMGDITLTIDSGVQRIAEAQLEGVTGAAVAMNSSTGEILACASSPAYDPAEKADDDCYYNRATQGLMAPGSTFKIVTMAAALESGIADGDTVYNADDLRLTNGSTVINSKHAEYGDITLEEAMALSSNTAFARLGMDLGSSALVDMAEAFGYNNSLSSKALNASTSTMGDCPGDYATSWASVGQPGVIGSSTAFGPSCTVVQAASVISTVANDGIRCEPLLVKEGPLADTPSSERVLTSDNASKLYDILVGSSHVEGKDIAGKTGTAQTGVGDTFCWYVCADRDANVAVAVCIEGKKLDSGKSLAMNRALTILDAAKNR